MGSSAGRLRKPAVSGSQNLRISGAPRHSRLARFPDVAARTMIVPRPDSARYLRVKPAVVSESIMGRRRIAQRRPRLNCRNSLVFVRWRRFIAAVDSDNHRIHAQRVKPHEHRPGCPSEISDDVDTYRLTTSSALAKISNQLKKLILFLRRVRKIRSRSEDQGGIPADRGLRRRGRLFATPPPLVAIGPTGNRIQALSPKTNLILAGIGVGFMLYFTMKNACDLGAQRSCLRRL